MLILKALVISLVLVYTAIITAVFTQQNKLIYRPSPIALDQQARVAGIIKKWPSVQAFRGWSSGKERHDLKATVIVFHGNSGAALQRVYYSEALERLGFRVLLAEYPGYGGRDGTPSETVLVNDALETIDQANQLYGGPIYLWGESLGAAVVAGAANQTSVPLAGLIMFLPWHSLPALAQHLYWYLPARWMVRDQYNSAQNLQPLNIPIAVVMAGQDQLVPNAHSERLFQSLTTRKKLWRFESAGHNNVPMDPNLAWWGEVMQFLMDSPV